MNRHIFPLALVVLLLNAVAASAQVASNPQVPPPPPAPDASPMPGPALSPAATPPAGQPVPQPVPQPALQPGPQSPQPVPPPAVPYYAVPPQPLWQPYSPYTPAPPPGTVIVPAPRPGPGTFITIPGLETPHWDLTVDALWLERSVGNSVGLGFTSDGYVTPNGHYLPNETMYSDDVLLPLETGVRFQISRKISDQTAIEATYWGLQQWSVGETLLADPSGDTVLAYSPWLQLSSAIPGFNNDLSYSYSSQVHNAEVNERILLSAYSPYWAFGWLWGVRYFNLSDNFTLSGSDLDTGYSESLNYRTTNNMVGPQLGLQCVRGWDRFQLITEAKIGVLANFYTQQGTDVAGGNPSGFTPMDISRSGTDVSALFEASIMARFRVSQYLWLRAGYQFYAVTGLALGPRQLGGADHNGVVGLDGLSLGLETAW